MYASRYVDSCTNAEDTDPAQCNAAFQCGPALNHTVLTKRINGGDSPAQDGCLVERTPQVLYYTMSKHAGLRGNLLGNQGLLVPSHHARIALLHKQKKLQSTTCTCPYYFRIWRDAIITCYKQQQF